MKNTLLIISLLFISIQTYTQQQIEWQVDLEISEDSFQGELPNLSADNIQQYSFMASFDFNFQMLSLQFAFYQKF